MIKKGLEFHLYLGSDFLNINHNAFSCTIEVFYILPLDFYMPGVARGMSRRESRTKFLFHCFPCFQRLSFVLFTQLRAPWHI